MISARLQGVCDAVIEFLSDSTLREVRRDTEEKWRDYALAGVKEYTILDPSGEHMNFYRLTAEERYGEIQPDAEDVIHSEVLPGFQFRYGDLWRRPDLTELALDEVYSGYVIPGFRAAMTARRVAEEEAAAEAAARQVAEEQAATEAAARLASGGTGASFGSRIGPSASTIFLNAPRSETRPHFSTPQRMTA